MNQLAAQGKSIIMISSELPELLRMSDRIAVMCEGRLVGELTIENCEPGKHHVLRNHAGNGVTNYGIDDEKEMEPAGAAGWPLALVILYVFFSIFGNNFFSVDMLKNILESSYYIGFMAFGVTFVIITGGIDLSIGTVMMCSALIGAFVFKQHQWPLWLALLLTVGVGTAFGLLSTACSWQSSSCRRSSPRSAR